MSRQECEDTKEMVQQSSISQKGTMEGVVRIDGGSLGEVQGRGKQGACEGWCGPLDWRIVKKQKRYQPRKWRGLLGQNLLLVSEHSAGRKNGRRGSQAATEDGSHGKNEEGMKGEGQNGRAKTVGGSVICWLLIAKMRGVTHNERTPCSNGTTG